MFVRQFDGPVEDLLAPHDWSIVDTEIGDKGYGITALPHMKALVIAGPSKVGVSDAEPPPDLHLPSRVTR